MVEVDSGGHLIQPICSSRGTWSRLSRMMLRHFEIFPRMKISHLPWATCATAFSLSHYKSVSLCSDVTSCFSICAHCLLCLRQLVQNLALSSLLPPFRYLYTLVGFPLSLSFHSQQSPPSVFPHMRQAPSPQSS